METRFLPTALATRQTRTATSRFNAAVPEYPGHEVLYLAENHLVALLEVEALLGSPADPRRLVPHPHRSWTTLNVTVSLQKVADLTELSIQQSLAITAQELTGDWLGYSLRGPATTVKSPTGPAPTQELGAALFDAPFLEGFISLSSKAPYHETLTVFPEKLLPGSRLSWFNPQTGVTEVISPLGAPERPSSTFQSWREQGAATGPLREAPRSAPPPAATARSDG